MTVQHDKTRKGGFMKRHYLLMLSVALLIAGCSGVDWFPANNTTNSGTISQSTTPSITMAFSPTSVPVGTGSTLTYTITNALNNPAQSGLGFTNQLDTSLSVAINLQQCGGTAVQNGSKIIFSGGTLAAGTSSCIITANVTGTTAGSFTDKSSDITLLTGGLTSGASDKILTVTAAPASAPSLAIKYQPTGVFVGYSTALTFAITNGTGNPAQSGLGFKNQLDPSLTVTAATPQCGGSVAVSNSPLIFS